MPWGSESGRIGIEVQPPASTDVAAIGDGQALPADRRARIVSRGK